MSSPIIDVRLEDLEYFTKLVDMIPAYLQFKNKSDTDDEYMDSENHDDQVINEETSRSGATKYYVNRQKESNIPTHKAANSPGTFPAISSLTSQKEDLSAVELKQKISQKLDEIHLKQSIASQKNAYTRLQTDKPSRSELRKLATLRVKQNIESSKPNKLTSDLIESNDCKFKETKDRPSKLSKKSTQGNSLKLNRTKPTNTISTGVITPQPSSEKNHSEIKVNSRPTNTLLKPNASKKLGKFDLAGKNKNQQPTAPLKKDLTHTIEKLLEKKTKMQKLEKSNSKKANEINQKEAWNNAIIRSQGGKIMDNPVLLKKTLKRKQQKKAKSTKEWNTRLENHESAKNFQNSKKRPGFEGANFKKFKNKK